MDGFVGIKDMGRVDNPSIAFGAVYIDEDVESNIESAPITLKKENHGGTENIEVHRVLLISVIRKV
jgi:hypothetical protein